MTTSANSNATRLYVCASKKCTHALVQPSLAHLPTHPRPHSLAHSLTHSPIHPLTHSLTHMLTHKLSHALLTHSLTHPNTRPPTHTPSSLPHLLPHRHLTHLLSHVFTVPQDSVVIPAEIDPRSSAKIHTYIRIHEDTKYTSNIYFVYYTYASFRVASAVPGCTILLTNAFHACCVRWSTPVLLSAIFRLITNSRCASPWTPITPPVQEVMVNVADETDVWSLSLSVVAVGAIPLHSEG